MSKKSGPILIVDDEVEIRETLEVALAIRGWEVITVANGQEAIDLLASGKKPSLILLDLMMPVMNGWEFLIQRKRVDPSLEIPVVVVSAYTDRAPADSGIADSLQKPFDLARLFEIVERYCG